MIGKHWTEHIPTKWWLSGDDLHGRHRKQITKQIQTNGETHVWKNMGAVILYGRIKYMTIKKKYIYYMYGGLLEQRVALD